MSYMGKILRINLTTKEATVEPLKEEDAKNFMGGAGLAMKLYYDEKIKPGIDPYDEQNKVILTTGFTGGTSCPTNSRIACVTKSPLTNGVTFSNVGGFFPDEFKKTGFDGMIFEGKSEKPVYVYVKDDKVSFKDASGIWGLNTFDAQHYIKEELKDQSVRPFVIGPAGENLVRYAAVIAEKRAAGRKGVGAVMGSKNLKGLVVKGTQKPKIHDEKGFQEAVKKVLKAMQESPTLYPKFGNFGTAGNVENCISKGQMPGPNFCDVPAGEEYLPIGAQENIKLRARRYGCYLCPIRCGQVRVVKSGKWKGWSSEGPEFETLFSYGSQVGVKDPGFIIAADRVSDELGLDTVSAGVVIGYAMELYEKGILSKEELDGYDLKFGNDDAAFELLYKIAYREGVGDLMAEGVKKMAEKIGKDSGYYAMHVKGLEPPGYDPRTCKSMGLTYMTVYTGAEHSRGYPPQEIFGAHHKVPWEVDPYSWDRKAELTIYNQDIGGACKDCAMLCTFMYRNALIPVNKHLKLTAELWKTATGFDVTEEDVAQVGERYNNLAHALLLKEGFTRKDDYLPERLMKEVIKEGPGKGQVMDKENCDKLLDEFYKLRGWDKEGVPTREKLDELGMDYVANFLGLPDYDFYTQ
jgi:aldehyde:ferredoxin oxidoreductase